MTDRRTPLVSIENVRFVYPGSGVVALDGVSLALERGTVLAVVGQNGSGKTTLSKHLNGLLRPTSGRVLVDGQDTSRASVQELARRVGYAFQDPGHQLFAKSVAEELAFGPRNLGYPPEDIETRVADVVRALGLGATLAMHPYRLPRALRKLVSIGSVLTMGPSLLVLDEPTTGQDHRTAGRIAGLIRALGDAGTSIVCVTHDMPLVAEVADRVVALTDGRIVADGTPREVVADRALMARARLAPPQITELSLSMPERAGRPGVLAIQELVDELRSAS